MDPKLALKPRVVLQKIPSPLTIKKEVDAEAVQKDVKDILSGRVRCHYCTETFSSVGACHRHEGRHKGTRCFQCTLCEKSYTRADHLRRHMLSHTGVKPFKCDSCEKRFADRSQLVQHHRTHTNDRPYKCTECDMAFRQYGHLKQHGRQHTFQSLSEHTCNSSEKQCAYRSHLVQHQQSHTNRRPYKCTECDMAFRQISNLQQHSRQHTFHRLSTGYERTLQTTLFACSICDKVLTSKWSLKSHVRIAHTGERPYKCKDCDETFASRQRYFYHKQSHHEEARYECPDCGRHFAALWQMKKHNLLHENEPDYVCPECGNLFRQALYLKYHFLRHSEAQICHVCGKLLPNAAQLRAHVKCHLLPKVNRLNKLKKLFDCGECGKQFTERRLVMKHFTTVHTKVVKRNSTVKTEIKDELWE